MLQTVVNMSYLLSTQNIICNAWVWLLKLRKRGLSWSERSVVTLTVAKLLLRSTCKSSLTGCLPDVSHHKLLSILVSTAFGTKSWVRPIHEYLILMMAVLEQWLISCIWSLSSLDESLLRSSTLLGESFDLRRWAQNIRKRR